MKNIFFLTLFIILGPTIAMGADNYYCDCQTGADGACVAGDDANSGNSPDAARQSFANAQSIFSNLAAGDSIQFCQGGSFSAAGANTVWANYNSTEENPVTVTDYDPTWSESQLARPIITQPNNSRLFQFSRDGLDGYVFSNLDIRCTACESGGDSVGFFLYNNVNGVTLENINIEGFRIGVQAAAGDELGYFSLDRITIRRVTMVNNIHWGFLGMADDLTIEDSYFENNGDGSVFDHNIYISGGTNIIVRGNESYRSSMDSNGSCNGTSIVAHGDILTMLIEDNIVREDIGAATPACWGIAIAPGYAASESFRNVTIRNNELINVGNTAIDIAGCANCLIENNTILQQQNFESTAIAALPRRDANDLAMDEITIRNNSIYSTASSGLGIRIGAEGINHTLVSNAIHYSGTGNFSCLNVELPASAFRAVDHNLCFFPNASWAEWERGSGTSPTPLGAWQGASGMGFNSEDRNPGFNQPELPYMDFTPVSDTAGVVEFGHDFLSAPKDFRGKNRDARPDAGAFEFGSFNPPGSTILYVD